MKVSIDAIEHDDVGCDDQKDRLIKLNAIAIQQMKLLTDDHGVRKLEEGK